MTRVSTAEMYDDKDIITQICKLKDGLNSALGGIIADIDIVNDELVIDWADGESIALPLPSPTGISSIAGSVAGGNLTMTIYMTDGSSHAFTCPLNGMASESYVDTKDAQNVKLSGAQTIADVKTFSDSPLVPTTPSGPTAAVCDAYVCNATAGVNNIFHKDATPETIPAGAKSFAGTGGQSAYTIKTTDMEYIPNTGPSGTSNTLSINFVDVNNYIVAAIRIHYETNGATSLKGVVRDANGNWHETTLLGGI